jgi:hypothetical protein
VNTLVPKFNAACSLYGKAATKIKFPVTLCSMCAVVLIWRWGGKRH